MLRSHNSRKIGKYHFGRATGPDDIDKSIYRSQILLCIMEKLAVAFISYKFRDRLGLDGVRPTRVRPAPKNLAENF